jgi:hypothetical protein
VRPEFVGSNVGSMSGFLRLPDIDFTSRIMGLGSICRVCRVSVSRESSEESGGIRMDSNRGCDSSLTPCGDWT